MPLNKETNQPTMVDMPKTKPILDTNNLQLYDIKYLYLIHIIYTQLVRNNSI